MRQGMFIHPASNATWGRAIIAIGDYRWLYDVNLITDEVYFGFGFYNVPNWGYYWPDTCIADWSRNNVSYNYRGTNFRRSTSK